MKRFTRFLGGAAACGLLLSLAAAGTAHAQFAKTDQKCRDSIAKAFIKAVATADKVSAKCHKSRNGDKIPDTTDCNDLSLAEADDKGKFQKSQTKLTDTVQKKCIDAGAGAVLFENYISCPEPCGTDLALPNPLTSYSELGQCLACVAGSLVEERNLATLGAPASGMTKDEEKCHAAVAKGYGKHLSTILKERTKCQKNEDKNGNTELTPCSTADDKGKIQKALDKAEDGLDKSCTGVDLTTLDSCDDTDLNALKACLLAQNDATGGEAFMAPYELPPTICPAAVDSQVLAGFGLGGAQSRSFLQVGWTGQAHDLDLPDKYFISSDLSCPAQPPCGDCTVAGISTTGPQYDAFTRCSDNNDMHIPCDEPFGPDVDDCGGGQCSYILGPPLPISAASTPTCSVNMLETDVTGTVNPEAGSAELAVSLRTRVHTGGSAVLTRPCPVCAGSCSNKTTPCPFGPNDCQVAFPGKETICEAAVCIVKCADTAECSGIGLGTCETDVAQDGIKNGTCFGGGRASQTCDIQAFDSTFAPDADKEGLSLDCPPSIGTNISGSGLLIPLEFTTGSASIAFEDPCDSPLGFLDCACGECVDTGPINTGLTCRTDADCAPTGTCSKGGGRSRQPNECANVAGGAACVDVGNETGECDGGAADQITFCNGVLRANGNGYISCDTNADCASSDCGGVPCGLCTISQTKACFLDPILATGEPDPDNPLLVTTFCIPPTSASVAINNSAGLPGPARVAADMLTSLRY